MRIGLNTGPMVVGNMGSKSRMDYTMMGDSVNLAARLEGVNKQYGTQVMISEFTRRNLGPDIMVHEVDSIRVVGKKEPVIIFEVLGKNGEVKPEKMAVLGLFEKGRAHYKRQEWKKAISFFHQALEKDEDDGPSLSFLERCVEFQSSGPLKDWDGVYEMKTK